MEETKPTRRSFLQTVLAGGAAAATANLTIMKDLFAHRRAGRSRSATTATSPA